MSLDKPPRLAEMIAEELITESSKVRKRVPVATTRTAVMELSLVLLISLFQIYAQKEIN